MEVFKDELKCVKVPSVCCVVQWRLSLNVCGVLESFMMVLNVLHDELAHLQVSIFCGQVQWCDPIQIYWVLYNHIVDDELTHLLVSIFCRTM